MVQLQLCTLEHLMNSGFGHPYPRHGLQLLFWFASQCVTCELVNCVITMKLVSDCQPERGDYGFHPFGNIEQLLPVLGRRRKRKVSYYEVGNLNTVTYPAAANLPTYVRENYELDGNYGCNNVDRIIISYHVETRVVEAMYVTEHDEEELGRFRADGTHQIFFELVQALQSPELDLSIFLTQMDYYGDFANGAEVTRYSRESFEQLVDTFQTYSEFMGRTMQNNFQFFTEAFNQQLDHNTNPFNYDQQVQYTVSAPSYNSRPVVNYSGRKSSRKTMKKARAARQSYWEWKQIYEDFEDKVKKRDDGGGFSLVKILLGAGAVYLAVKCLNWLSSLWKEDVSENTLKMIPWRTPTYRPPHIMLDYVY